MNKNKKLGITTLIISVISMIWGIGVVSYYVDNLLIRALSVFIFVVACSLVSNTVKSIFKEY